MQGEQTITGSLKIRKESRDPVVVPQDSSQITLQMPWNFPLRIEKPEYSLQKSFPIDVEYDF